MAAAAIPTRDPIIEKPPRRRRWIPLSLRMLVALLLVLVSGTAAIGLSVWLPYHRELRVIQAVESRGGFWRTETTGGPDWLRQLIADDPRLSEFKVFARVDYVNLGGTGISDAEVTDLTDLTNLRVLHLWGTSVTDSSLVKLGTMKNLQILSLEQTMVTSGGIEYLKTALPYCEIFY